MATFRACNKCASKRPVGQSYRVYSLVIQSQSPEAPNETQRRGERILIGLMNGEENLPAKESASGGLVDDFGSHLRMNSVAVVIVQRLEQLRSCERVVGLDGNEKKELWWGLFFLGQKLSH